MGVIKMWLATDGNNQPKRRNLGSTVDLCSHVFSYCSYGAKQSEAPGVLREYSKHDLKRAERAIPCYPASTSPSGLA